jgi:SAM-dependent methyltransferase
MKTATCINCNHASPLLFKAKDYNRRVSKEFFSYYCCPSCKLIFLNPVPQNLGEYYRTDYYDVPDGISEHDARAKKFQQWKIDLVNRFLKKGKLLEIGPAYGLFSHLAKQSGFDVTAIEMDSRCCDYLRDIVGINVIHDMNTASALSSLPKFDAIVFWQVLEHLIDPMTVLDLAAEHLAPGGVLIFDTPNPNAFQFRVLGKYWTHIDAPRHVTLIPIELVVSRLKIAGLHPELLTSSDISANGFNGFGWAFSFKNFFSNSVLGSAAHLFGRFLAKLLIPIERTGWRGSSYTVVFRKSDV